MLVASAAIDRFAKAFETFTVAADMAARQFSELAWALGIQVGVRTVDRPHSWSRWQRRAVALASTVALVTLAAAQAPHG